MNCRNCGFVVAKDDKFCTHCGSRISHSNLLADSSFQLSIAALFLSILPIADILIAIVAVVAASLAVAGLTSQSEKRATVSLALSLLALVISVAVIWVGYTYSDMNSQNGTDRKEYRKIPKEEFISSCSKLNYKSVARNPDKFIGQNFYFIGYVASAKTTKRGEEYYITYQFDLERAQKLVDSGKKESISETKLLDYDSDVDVWLIDERNKNSPDYLKILEGDIIKAYGTFNGMIGTENHSTGEKGEAVALDIEYVEILAD